MNVALDGPMFADGPGSHAVIARLPLAEGYTTIVPQPRHAYAEGRRQAVEGRRQGVGHGAGRHVRRVEGEVKGEDGGVTTLWVAADSRQVAKITADAAGDERRRAHGGTGEVGTRDASPRRPARAPPVRHARRAVRGPCDRSDERVTYLLTMARTIRIAMMISATFTQLIGYVPPMRPFEALTTTW